LGSRGSVGASAGREVIIADRESDLKSAAARASLPVVTGKGDDDALQ
jgi:hypothetical protein